MKQPARSRATKLALGACVLVVAAVVACAEELPIPVECTNIPAGGCPRKTGACSDPACEALYVCRADGTWRLDSPCAESLRDAAAEAAPIADATPPPRDVEVDVPGASGGPGCESLVAPDCSLALAAGCGASCCGCEDLFVCENNGWTLWGRCEGGSLIPD